jgi:hypothetical protein
MISLPLQSAKPSSPLRLLFVKDNMAWPRSSGHDVHCFYMMQALTRLGHEVSLLTAAAPAPEAVAVTAKWYRVSYDSGQPLSRCDLYAYVDAARHHNLSWSQG